MNSIRYVYFGDVTGAKIHDGVVAVGYTFDPINQRMQYAVAFCSPNDKFSKAKAHSIIMSRLKYNLFTFSAEKYQRPPLYEETIVDIITYFELVAAPIRAELEAFGPLNLAGYFKDMVNRGIDFTDGDVFEYIDQWELSWDKYVSKLSIPKFCGVSIPFWALHGIVQGRK